MKYLLLFLLTFPVFSQAQIKGVVLDENNKPIPYATLMVESTSIIVNSEEDGSFAISVPKNQNLIVSAVGYETKKVESIAANTIILKRDIFELDEVVIAKPQYKKQIEIAKFKGTVRIYQLNELTGKAFPFSENMKEFPFLKEIMFYSESEIDSAKVNLMIKELNADGSPGENLIDYNMIVRVKKGSRNTIVDVRQFLVRIPKNGIFISIEGLRIKENQVSRDYDFKDKDGKIQKYKSVMYQPNFGFLPSKENTTWFYESGKWKQHEVYILEDHKSFTNVLMRKYHEKYLDIPISLTLTN